MDPELFAAVESPGLSAQVNVVSGYRQFVRALASAPEVQKLADQMKESDAVAEVLSRLLGLVQAPYDPAYEHPHDVALAAYLWVLSMANLNVAYLAAQVVRGCTGCYWGRKVAEQFVATRKERAESHGVAKVVAQLCQPPSVKATASHSGNCGPIYFGVDLSRYVALTKERRGAGTSWTSFDMAQLGDRKPKRNRGARNRISRLSFEAVS